MSRAHHSLKLLRAAPLMVVMLLGACSKLLSLTQPKADAKIAALAVVQGDAQSAQAGRALATPIVVRVLDAKGKGIAKQSVTLVVTAGGGTIDLPTAVSDSSGEFKVKWTLGTAGINQTLAASVDSLDPLVVKASAIFPSALVVAQGAAQTAKVSSALKNDVVVRVQGGSGVPMVGVTVTFRVTAGGGAITPQSGVTNSAGEISAKWTVGAVAGANSVVAESGTLAPAVISATGTP